MSAHNSIPKTAPLRPEKFPAYQFFFAVAQQLAKVRVQVCEIRLGVGHAQHIVRKREEFFIVIVKLHGRNLMRAIVSANERYFAPNLTLIPDALLF